MIIRNFIERMDFSLRDEANQRDESLILPTSDVPIDT